MKVKCPICGIEGHLQVRGNSARVGHYQGYSGRTRIVKWHRVDKDTLSHLVNSGNQTMENGNKNVVIKKANLGSKMVRGVGFEPTNPCGIAASGLRLWPCLATPAHT